MNVLDEHMLESQRDRLRKWRIPFRQIGHEIGRKGMKDAEILKNLRARLERRGPAREAARFVGRYADWAYATALGWVWRDDEVDETFLWILARARGLLGDDEPEDPQAQERIWIALASRELFEEWERWRAGRAGRAAGVSSPGGQGG